MNKPRVLVIETGGTIAQKRGRDGIFRPTEKTITPMVRGIRKFADVQVERLPKLIDSTNMLTDQRASLATMIYKRAHEFDGFVIVHGTDTMADTAASLTFMLQGLGKPVVLTGSQISIYEERTDGKSNLSAAIRTATQDYGEVLIAFGNGVFRGPRTVKDDEEGLNAFFSPRTPPVGKIGITVEPCDNRIARFNGETRLFTEFDTKIAFVYPMSGISIDTFSDQVKQENIHGFVFVGFGAGNIPETYYGGIEQATRLNKPIVVVTQCSKGAADMGIYAVGAEPLKLGAISGGDMTMQTATQKLMYALGKAAAEGISTSDIIRFVKQIMHTDYAKEITVERLKAFMSR
ncbi:Glutamyl-tRNA(Gln) amidotransferase subunit D [Candidatus Anstonella stagnisolia]|nr:Glutamyl-tRNA(Gln) amidotransferase subunit D [Candidatus Anstonella stagnisolia]